jgi:hypothetical protein
MADILSTGGLQAAAAMDAPAPRVRLQYESATVAPPAGRLYESGVVLLLLTVQIPWVGALLYLALRVSH